MVEITNNEKIELKNVFFCMKKNQEWVLLEKFLFLFPLVFNSFFLIFFYIFLKNWRALGCTPHFERFSDMNQAVYTRELLMLYSLYYIRYNQLTIPVHILLI